MNEWFKNNWKAFAPISGMVIAGVGGYTNLLIEFGELRAEVHYLRTALGNCIENDGDI